MTLYEQTARGLMAILQKREATAAEITQAFLDRIAAVEEKVRAYILVDPAGALQVATPAASVPIAIKDNLCTKAYPTTCASKILQGYQSPYDATVVSKIYQAGMIPLGKTNMDEFAMGSSTENSAVQVTRNPWNLDCVPGGSSGGSAAAVAAGEAPWALGSDTGGSIRQPASFCGVVGLKPTYGRVSRYGLVAFASSLDQIGPLTRDVYDCALLMNVIAGHDPKDSTSVDLPVPDYTQFLLPEIKDTKIGLVKELLGEGIDPEVKQAIQAAAQKLTELGGIVEEVSLPTLDYALPCYYLLCTAEASSNLARYDGVRYAHRSSESPDLLTMYYNTRREGFGPEVKRRIMLGAYALSAGYYDAYYLKAQKVRTLIKQDFDKAFATYRVLLMPTAPTVAFKIGEKIDDPLSMYLSDIATIPVNLAGIPAISIPCGFSKGLPIGLQILAKAFDEEALFRVAYTYEQATGWHKQRVTL